jgi:uncharacterized Tic20 family protein
MEDGNQTPAGPPMPPTPGQAPPPPGWGYPPPPRPSNSNTLALFAHLGSLVGGIIVPLVIYATAKDDPYVRRHATEALNFQITVLLASLLLFVPFIAMPFAFLGGMASPEAMAGGMVVFFVLFAVVWVAVVVLAIAGVVFSIMGAVRASRYEEYRYPIAIRLVKP